MQLWQHGERQAQALVDFHRIGYDATTGSGGTKKQGYALPVMAGMGHVYNVSLGEDGGGALPADWIIEFSDPVTLRTTTTTITTTTHKSQ